MIKRVSMWKVLPIGILSVVLLLGGFNLVNAAEFISPDGEEVNITIASGEVHNNLYTAGNTVVINSDTSGDLVVAGGSVTIEGSVEKDLIVAGGTVTINGAVGDDIRVAGGTVVINNTVGGDVISFGGSVRISEKAAITGDAIIFGGEVDLSAPVAGNLKVEAGLLTLNNSVTGKATLKADDKLVFGSNAKLLSEGSTYKSRKEPIIKEGAEVNNAKFVQLTEDRHVKGELAVIFTIGFLMKLIAMIIAAFVFSRLFPRTANTLVNSLANRPWMSLLVGFIGVIVAPISAVLLFLSFAGFYLAMIVLAIWVLYMLVSALLASVFVGTWITKLLMKKDTFQVDWQAIIIGVVALGILSLIPILGMLIVILIWLAAFGTMLRFVYHHIKQGEGGEVVVVEDQN